jgi:hypothetical protein
MVNNVTFVIVFLKHTQYPAPARRNGHFRFRFTGRKSGSICPYELCFHQIYCSLHIIFLQSVAFQYAAADPRIAY